MSESNSALLADQSLRQRAKINLNRATLKELVRLPHIGEITARRIIEYREQNGRINNLDELVLNLGMSAHKLDQIVNRLEL